LGIVIMPLYQIELPVFEGPLDLLLQLIEREELDITAVSLARVTNQYLERLAELEQRKTRDLADFLVVAAKLVLIKSAALLPRPSRPTSEEDTQDVGQDLVRQLQIYKRFKEIAGLLHEREAIGLRSYIRLAVPPRPAARPDLSAVTLDDLLALAQEALEAKSGPPVAQVVSPVTVTIEEQIELIERQLAQHRRIAFEALLSRAATRIEVIVTLWAILELIKRDRVCVIQDHLFGQIIIQEHAPVASGASRPTPNPIG
jgi:segregation and condensation protein A